MNKFFKFSYGFVSLASLGVMIWVFFNLQTTLDWWTLRGYEPSAEISRLADESFLSDEGRKLFYLHDPELLNKEQFQGKCSVQEETIVLGCYISRDKIYIFDVNDERLEGVEQVTAAHEMLHVVYERLSNSERENMDRMVTEYFATLNDERLTRTIENYRKRDPTIVPNELHSILATEVRDLPAELEEHFSKYFIDRLKVVALSEAYENEFTLLENQTEQFDIQLESLNSSIQENENRSKLLGSALEAEQRSLEALRGNTDLYNEAVPRFNQKVREYNQQLEDLRNEIAKYNDIAEKRNEIAVQEQKLIEAIDSRATEL